MTRSTQKDWIPLIRPQIEFEDIARDIQKIIESGWLTTGPYVRRFEEEFAAYVGARHAVSTTSATTALHLSLAAKGIGPEDEVLVSDFTFPASGNAIVQTGAVPVLVDCIPNRFDMDPLDARRKLSPKTKAIMVVHPFGQPAEMADIRALADEAGLWVLEDAACALGARRGQTKCGVLGDCACFSFHPRKILTTGEGGMITTDDSELFERISMLRAHGGVRGEAGFRFVENGFNYRMSEIQAALGLAQLQRFDALVERRRRVGETYIRQLSLADGISVPLSGEVAECAFQSFVVQLGDGIDRNGVIARMREAKIETTLGTYAMHTHPAFARFGYKAGDLEHSARAERQSLTLPLLANMSDSDISRVVESLLDALSPAAQCG